MKRFTVQQIQNIVFTAIVALAAILLYLFAGRCAPSREEAVPTPTAAPEIAQAETEGAFALVPESVYTAQVVGDDAYQARRQKDGERYYNLVYRDKKNGGAVLSYTVNGENMVNSVTLQFPLRDKPLAKPKSPAEKALANDYAMHIAAQNEAIQAMLPSVLSAADLEGVLLRPVLLRWYSGALTARDAGKTFTDTYADCAFTAYPTQLGKENVVICSLLLP